MEDEDEMLRQVAVEGGPKAAVEGGPKAADEEETL